MGRGAVRGSVSAVRFAAVRGSVRAVWCLLLCMGVFAQGGTCWL